MITRHVNDTIPGAYDANNFWKENAHNGVDADFLYIIVFVPREAGLLILWSAFYVHFGTANWLNFVPVYRAQASGEGGEKIGKQD